MKSVIKSLTEVPEPFKSEYEQHGDVYVLRLDGDPHPLLVESNTKLAEFRDNNRALNGLKTELEGKLRAFEGIDPKAHKEMKAKLDSFEKNGGVKEPSDVQSLIQKAMEPLQSKLQEEQQKREESEKRLKFRELESRISVVGSKSGIDERAMQDYLNRALDVFDLDGVARDGDTPLYSKKKPTEPLTPEEWTEGLITSAPHLFKQSKGGGGKGSGSGMASRTVSNDPMSIGQNLEAIAKGEAQVSLSE